MRRAHIILCWLLYGMASTVVGQQVSLGDRQAVSKLAPELALQLRSPDSVERQKAVETIRQVGQASSRALSDNLGGWITPLLESQCYDDALNLSAIAIIDRGFDISTVEKLQEARVQALLGQGKLNEALSEAKAFYNICVLKNTSHAIDLMCNILERQGKSTVASRLRFEQTLSRSTTKPADPPVQALDSGGLPLDATVLSWIKIDPSPWQQAYDGLAAGHTYNDLMKQGNLALLLDKPDLARKSFENACGMTDGASAKNTREAVEGIARSIRDMPDGSPILANNFINNLRNTPEIAGTGLVDGLSVEKLKVAAQQTVLAPVQTAAFPALEEQRAKEEKRSGFSAADLIKVARNFETATQMKGRMFSPTHYELTFADPLVDNWFMFRVENAKGKTIRIDIKNAIASLDNLSTLNPVYSYVTNLSDPDSYSTTAPSGKTMPIAAWNGSGALLPDTSGQKWHYIPNVWRVDQNTMALVTNFDQDSAYIAMRVPYPPSYNERFLKSLPPEAQLIEVGKSKQGKPLLMVKIGNGQEKTKPCVLLYAGEHADEFDSMWVANGAIEFLLSNRPDVQQLRGRYTFLVIPQLDPDASAIGHHDGMYLGFVTDQRTPESVAYSNWFRNWINDGHRIDLVFDLHNVQSRESGHVACAEMEGLGVRGELSLYLHTLLFDDLQAQNLSVNPQPWDRGWSPDRLGGWLARRYGPVCLHYEVNSQASERHLTLQELKVLGSTFVRCAAKFFEGPDGSKLLANVDTKRKQREDRWARASGTDLELDAIAAEAKVSYGVGRNTGPSSPPAEKWVP